MSLLAGLRLQIGQCYLSDGEPDLGLGFLKSFDSQTMSLYFPRSEEERQYRIRNAPLKRLILNEGDLFKDAEDKSTRILERETRDDLMWYKGADLVWHPESSLSPQLNFSRPLDRFIAGKFDALSEHYLRRRSLQAERLSLQSAVKGFRGPRIQLLPHQLFVASDIANRVRPRALLADEVGLGKTIEACLIVHRLVLTGRAKRVLILVPESLVNQWFVELFQKFHLSFWVPDSQALDALTAEDFKSQSLVILSSVTAESFLRQGFLKTTGWDMVVVDEAHRIQDLGSSALLTELSAQSPGLLLLTATPEQLGTRPHFERLKLLDPERFPDFEQFQNEQAQYQKAAVQIDEIQTAAQIENELAPQPHVGELRKQVTRIMDEHGTGRVYYRNSRARVTTPDFRFPKRKLVAVSTENVDETIVKFLETRAAEKTLLLCASPQAVAHFEKLLLTQTTLKTASFHEEMTLLARDRSAAYFLDPKGASVLLCSEIGGEGRNFQHAKTLILADLPLDPDALEQRIGRLDRIGQISEIEIFVPTEPDSRLARVKRWHEEVFQAFEKPAVGASLTFEKFKPALEKFLEKEKLPKSASEDFNALLREARAFYTSELQKIEAGRDRLLEIFSFDPASGAKMVDAILEEDRMEELRSFLEVVFDVMGLHSDDLDEDSMFVDPAHGQFVAYLPALPSEGLSFTFSRKKALGRNDLDLMTWEHPLVTETLEQIASLEFGNLAIAAWEKKTLALDCVFVFEPASVDAKWNRAEFALKAPLRVLITASGQVASDKLSEAEVRTLAKTAPHFLVAKIRKIQAQSLRALLEKAEQSLAPQKELLQAEARTRLQAAAHEEFERLEKIESRLGASVDEEKAWWQERQLQIRQAIDNAQLRIDSFLILAPEV